MVDHNTTSMDALAIADFLESQGTGVLSLAEDSEAYAIPVSFAFAPDDRRVYFRLGYASGSQKRMFVEATDHASFVVYDRTPDGWKSVIASGRLVELTETNLDASVVEAVNHLDIPFYKVFDRPTSELDFTIVALEVSDLEGRVEAD